PRGTRRHRGGRPLPRLAGERVRDRPDPGGRRWLDHHEPADAVPRRVSRRGPAGGGPAARAASVGPTGGALEQVAMRTIVVTGSASGMGAATRAALEADGDRVIGVDLRDAEVVADLSIAEGRRAAVEAVAER